MCRCRIASPSPRRWTISCVVSDHLDITAIEAAAKRIAPVAVLTPLLESPLLNRRLGGRLLLKAEMLQRTGSFKFRGAYNRISQLNADERRRGVVAFSSGNHAQGVAHAAALCGAPAVIVMPADAPTIKIENTRAYGAEVVLYDRRRDDREAIGRGIAAERGSILVPPFDDPHIIAGQGTVGLEIAAQCGALGITPDAVIAPGGGGGLVAGVSTAIRAKMPQSSIYVAEPRDYDDYTRSLASGRRESNAMDRISICDALQSPMPGELTFAINRTTLDGGLTVSDVEVAEAMRTAFTLLKVVIEPGGAVALASVLSGKLQPRGKTIVVVASGGNVDPELFGEILLRKSL
jgi:threonine dehydratase